MTRTKHPRSYWIENFLWLILVTATPRPDPKCLVDAEISQLHTPDGTLGARHHLLGFHIH